MKKIIIKKIYIDRDVINTEFTKNILQSLPNVPVINTTSNPEIFTSFTISEGKQILFITNYKGNFCKPCPATSQDYICCNYHVINETTGCPLDCIYCILQGYMNSKVLTVYANYQNIFREFDALSSKYSNRIIRIGTGELADSIALEEYTNISSFLIPYFESKHNVFFEFKTKTNHIKLLNKFAHKTNNLVLSWSLNPDQLIDNMELKAASLTERINSAQLAQKMGFKLSFHFDPIIQHDNWRDNYNHVIDSLFSKIKAQNIVWISMGGLRFPPALKQIIKERFPKTPIIRSEQITGNDQKIRYFKPLRLEMFKYLYNRIRSHSKEVFVYFCMENKDVWEKTMGYCPINSNHLDYLFAESLCKQFPEMGFTKPAFDYYQNIKSKHDPEYQSGL